MDLITITDLIGTFVFALSGVTVAIEKKFDFFGTIILAFVTAIGGGTLRDLMIGSTPVSWLDSNLHIYVIFLTIPISYFLPLFLRKLRKAFFLFDTIGIGVFTILGLQKSLEIGLSPLVSLLMGVISAVFGGVIRDVLSGEVPIILKKEIYAFACLGGGVLFLGLGYISDIPIFNMILSISMVVLIRLLSIRYKWSIPFNPR